MPSVLVLSLSLGQITNTHSLKKEKLIFTHSENCSPGSHRTHMSQGLGGEKLLSSGWPGRRWQGSRGRHPRVSPRGPASSASPTSNSNGLCALESRHLPKTRVSHCVTPGSYPNSMPMKEDCFESSQEIQAAMTAQTTSESGKNDIKKKKKRVILKCLLL